MEHKVYCRLCEDDLGICGNPRCTKTEDHPTPRGSLCTWCLQHDTDVQDYINRHPLAQNRR